MDSGNPQLSRAAAPRLHWQSQAVLLAFVPFVGTWTMLAAADAWQVRDPILWQAAVISIGFSALVYLLRAATAGATLTGGLFTAALYLQTPGPRTSLWPLLALFLLTYAATRFGRARKERMGIAEGKHGRRASQVAANLGAAVLVGVPPLALRLGLFPVERAGLVAMTAALAEATADTVSSETGQVLGGEPLLLTTFRRVPVGTDGGITLVGTAMGALAAAAVVLVAAWALPLGFRDAAVALVAAIAGLFFDSLLGAIPERRGWLNNDAVNALSTVAAALLALGAVRLGM